jgi:hypothetical protein
MYARRSLSLMLAVAAGVLSACGTQSFTEPSAVPGPAIARYRVSGIVTDETGSPIGMAKVEVDYFRGGASFSSRPFICPSPKWCWISMATNSRGEYTVELDAAESPQFPGHIGYVVSSANNFETNVQLLPQGAGAIAGNLRLRRVRTIDAGGSIAVSIEPDSSLCTDLEDLFAFEYRAEVIRVVAGKAGTLVIETQSTDAGRDAATIFWATTGNYAGAPVRTGPGAVSLPVQAGTYLLFIARPVGSSTATFNVTTFLQGS